jgi:polar amino acid transport system substrate-binding protein
MQWTQCLDRRRLLAGVAATSLWAAASQALAAPAGPLRAVLLDGNPVQARRDAAGQAHGPAVDVAEALARRRGAKLELIFAANVPGVLDAVRQGQADIAFIGYDPTRAEGMIFTPPYLMSLNRYAVRAGSPITAQDQVDRTGVKVAGVRGDAGGLWLQRNLHNATVVLTASFDESFAQLRSGAVDVMAANGQRLADARKGPGDFDILPGSFFGVPQAVAVRGDDKALADQASALVKAMLASGEIARSIEHWSLTGAAPAPPPA